MEQEGMTLLEFFRRFATEEACVDHLFYFVGLMGTDVPGVAMISTTFTGRVICMSASSADIRRLSLLVRSFTARGLL